MHVIEPARLKPGVSLRSLPAETDTDGEAAPPSAVISGRALVFWDPKNPAGTPFAKKLDAIDTDQITPATDAYRRASRRSTSGGRLVRSVT